MSNTNGDLVRRGASALANTTTGSAVGGTMIKAGGIGAVLYILAGLIPFVSFPMLLAILILGGVALKVKG